MTNEALVYAMDHEMDHLVPCMTLSFAPQEMLQDLNEATLNLLELPKYIYVDIQKHHAWDKLIYDQKTTLRLKRLEGEYEIGSGDVSTGSLNDWQ